MAYGYVTDVLYGTYAYFVPIYDTEGQPQGAMNLSKYTGGEYFAGITYVGSGLNTRYNAPYDRFYLIDRSGMLYRLDYLAGLGYIFNKLTDTGISTEGKWYYHSFYYDEETDYIFYSMYDGGEQSKLYAIKDRIDYEEMVEYFDVYKLGEFASKIWPVAGIYRWNASDRTLDGTNSIETTEGTLETPVSIDEVIRFEKNASRVPSLSDKPIKKLSEVNAEVAALAQAVLEAQANEEAANEEVTEETEETTEETTATTPDESVDGEGEESVSGNE
jgi:hypothetical protein